jgi:hypothetical protein
MKKSIANKIEHLLRTLVSSPESSKNTYPDNAKDLDPDNMHYEKNPDRPCKTKLPQRLMDLLRPKRNPEFR